MTLSHTPHLRLHTGLYTTHTCICISIWWDRCAWKDSLSYLCRYVLTRGRDQINPLSRLPLAPRLKWGRSRERLCDTLSGRIPQVLSVCLDVRISNICVKCSPGPSRSLTRAYSQGCVAVNAAFKTKKGALSWLTCGWWRVCALNDAQQNTVNVGLCKKKIKIWKGAKKQKNNNKKKSFLGEKLTECRFTNGFIYANPWFGNSWHFQMCLLCGFCIFICQPRSRIADLQQLRAFMRFIIGIAIPIKRVLRQNT